MILLTREFGIFEVKVDSKLDQMFEQIDEKAMGYRDDVLTKLDGMGELQNMREDREIGTHQISELREKVDGHEKRISKLEQRQVA